MWVDRIEMSRVGFGKRRESILVGLIVEMNLRGKSMVCLRNSEKFGRSLEKKVESNRI